MTLRDVVRNAYVYTHTRTLAGSPRQERVAQLKGVCWHVELMQGGERGSAAPRTPTLFSKAGFSLHRDFGPAGTGSQPLALTHPYLENSYWSRNKGTSGSLWTLRSLFYIRHLLQSFKPGRYYLHHWKPASTNCCHQIIFGRISFTKITSAMFGIRWKKCPPINESGLRCL